MDNLCLSLGYAQGSFLLFVLFGLWLDELISSLDRTTWNLRNMVSAFTDSVRASIKENSERWSEKQEQTKRERELAQLCPIFEDDLDNAIEKNS